MLVRYSAAEEISRLGIHLQEYHSCFRRRSRSASASTSFVRR